MHTPQQTTWKSRSLALVLLILLCVLVVVPLSLLFSNAMPDSAADLDELRHLILAEPLQQSILRTLVVALLACGLASVLAIPVAGLAAAASPWVKTLIQGLGLLPLAMPPFVSAAVLRHFAEVFNQTPTAASSGTLIVQGNELALILVFAVHFMPFILFSLMIGLAHLDRSMSESARNLGAGRLTVWFRILSPLATPAYIVGAAITVLKIFEDVGTPMVLGVEPMLAPQLLFHLNDGGISDPQLMLTAVSLFGVSLLVVSLAWSALTWMFSPMAELAAPARRRRAPGTHLLLAALILVLMIIALAPHFWLFMMIGGVWDGQLLPMGYDLTTFGQLGTDFLPGLGTTLAYAAAAGVVTALLGSGFAPLTCRSSALGHLMRCSTIALFAVPGLVLALAYGYMRDLLPPGLAEQAHLAWIALILVVALKQLPFAQRLLVRPLLLLRHGGLESAHSLGGSGFTAGLRIGLPVLAGGISLTFLLGLIATTIELSAALVLMSDPQAPLAAELFKAIQQPAQPDTMATGAILMVAVLLAGLLLAYTLSRRGRYQDRPLPSHPARRVREQE